MTLGQQRNNLDFRLRTPITGENGADLTLNIPNIFTDTNPHHIIVLDLITSSDGDIPLLMRAGDGSENTRV
ncbi:hypothetical protein [Nostoc commune]|uniref:hypothetical protein n=1 Tax=Nostoc commune TaxID=1178 RepID=UPI0018C6FABA|nr:hypothetical protein [Nostoc commune]MBG1264428.1 hypothetical protein [Nostoc commune BAE]